MQTLTIKLYCLPLDSLHVCDYKTIFICTPSMQETKQHRDSVSTSLALLSRRLVAGKWSYHSMASTILF